MLGKEETAMKVSRRDLLKDAGLFLFGASVAGLSPSLQKDASGAAPGQQEAAEIPWPYKKLNPEAVAENGYAGYYKGACCYGAFEGILAELRKEIGSPYTMIPTSMMVFGEGGVAGRSTLCGALNGASAAIFLAAGNMEKKEVAFALIHELYNWYEQEPLPNYRPKSPKFEIVKSLSHSPLCHASVTNWCKTAKFKAFSKERSERCAWLTASVAKYAVELLNKNADGGFKGIYKLSAETETCRNCHDKGGNLENTRGMMECGGCHFTPKTTHPKI